MKRRKKRSPFTTPKVETRVSKSDRLSSGRWRDPYSQPNSGELIDIQRITFRWTGGSVYSIEALKKIKDIINLRYDTELFISIPKKKDFGPPDSQPGSLVLSDFFRIIFNWIRGDLYSTEALGMIGTIVASGGFFEDILKHNGWSRNEKV